MKNLTLLLLFITNTVNAECWVSTTTGQTVCNSVSVPPPTYYAPPPTYYVPPPIYVVPPQITPGNPPVFIPYETGKIVPRGGTKTNGD
jgi:hypothetical protein